MDRAIADVAAKSAGSLDAEFLRQVRSDVADGRPVSDADQRGVAVVLARNGWGGG